MPSPLTSSPHCQVLACHKATRGPFPKWMLDAHPIAQMFVASSGAFYEVDPPRVNSGVYLIRARPDATLRALLRAHVGDAFGCEPGKPIDQFIAFTEHLLTIDPTERPTAAAAYDSAYVRALQRSAVMDATSLATAVPETPSQAETLQMASPQAPW